MGQKTNVLTLRKNKTENLNLNSGDTKLFLQGFFFLKHFERLLLGKGILVVDKTLNYENKQFSLNLTAFFRSTKMISYKRKKLIHKKKALSLVKHSALSTFFKNQFSFCFYHFSSYYYEYSDYYKYFDLNFIYSI